jgi:hypothetical protein
MIETVEPRGGMSRFSRTISVTLAATDFLNFSPGGSMSTEPQKIYQLKLTPAQQQEIRELTGKDSDTVSLRVEELEERIAPGWTNN